MAAEKFGWLAALIGIHHFLPQGYACAWVVTRAGSQLQADSIRFGFVGAAEMRCNQGLIADISQRCCILAEAECRGTKTQRSLGGNRLGYLFPSMLA